MTIALADEIMGSACGSVHSKAKSIVTAMGCGLRCNALDVEGVREKLRAGGHRVDLPDISPEGESYFVLETVFEYEQWKDLVYLRSSRRTSGEPGQRRPPASLGRKSHKDPRAEKEKTRGGAKRRPGDNTKTTAPRAGGDTEPETPSPPKKPTSEDPFKIYTREGWRTHYEKMKEERSSRTAGAGRGTWKRIVRAGALTELTRQTPPPLPNKTNPTLEEMSHERDMGPSASGEAYSSPLSTIEPQQGNNFTPSKKIDGVEKQCCIRCNSHTNCTCQGAKAHLWHGSAAISQTGLSIYRSLRSWSHSEDVLELLPSFLMRTSEVLSPKSARRTSGAPQRQREPERARRHWMLRRVQQPSPTRTAH